MQANLAHKSGLGNGTPVQVLLAETYPKIRLELRNLLSSQGFKMVAEVTDNHNAVRLARQFDPDIAVLDAAGEFLAGLKAAKEILLWKRGAGIILLSLHSEIQYTREALRTGVRGYVLKTRAAADLGQAIHEVSRGGIYLSPGVSPWGLKGHLLGNE